MQVLSLILGWITIISSTFIWVGYSIYKVLKTDQGFFEIALPNLGFWVLQIVVGFFLVGLALATGYKKTK